MGKDGGGGGGGGGKRGGLHERLWTVVGSVGGCSSRGGTQGARLSMRSWRASGVSKGEGLFPSPFHVPRHRRHANEQPWS